MALNASILSILTRAEIMSRPAIGALDNAALTALCDAIAAAVVQHITTTAVVNAAGTSAPGGGPVAVVGTVT